MKPGRREHYGQQTTGCFCHHCQAKIDFHFFKISRLCERANALF
jgi:hypothetical protein